MATNGVGSKRPRGGEGNAETVAYTRFSTSTRKGASMKVKPLTCPRCGADLVPNERKLSYRCPVCGLSVALDFTDTDGLSEEERSARIARDVARAERDKARFERDKERAERDRARAPYDAQILKTQVEFERESREREITYEKEKQRYNDLVGFAAIGILLLLCLSALLLSNCSKIKSAFTGDIPVPASSGDIKGIAYTDAVQRFEDAGFYDIECIDLNDISFVSGFFTDENSVDHVTINGEEDFSTSSYYPPDAKIRIYYHSRPD